jgi:hypothetical protein
VYIMWSTESCNEKTKGEKWNRVRRDMKGRRK